MAFKEVAHAAIKAISTKDLDMKKNYQFNRKVINVAHHHWLKALYHTWDHAFFYQDHEIPVRLFAPEKGPADSILLFFHGGGWVTGNIDSYNRVCANMAELTGQLVVSVDYRLAPEHRFPAAFEDCYFVMRELFLKSHLFDIAPERITLIGDSAGANLAAAVSLAARDRGHCLPTQQILLYPATYNDHSPASPYESIRENGTDYLLTSKRICDYMELYMSQPEDLQNPYFAPLLTPDFSNQPRTLLITAEFDPLRDEGEAYGAELLAAGNEVEMHRLSEALHGFFTLPPSFNHVEQAYELINNFLAGRAAD